MDISQFATLNQTNESNHRDSEWYRSLVYTLKSLEQERLEHRLMFLPDIERLASEARESGSPKDIANYLDVATHNSRVSLGIHAGLMKSTYTCLETVTSARNAGRYDGVWDEGIDRLNLFYLNHGQRFKLFNAIRNPVYGGRDASDEYYMFTGNIDDVLEPFDQLKDLMRDRRLLLEAMER